MIVTWVQNAIILLWYQEDKLESISDVECHSQSIVHFIFSFVVFVSSGTPQALNTYSLSLASSSISTPTPHLWHFCLPQQPIHIQQQQLLFIWFPHKPPCHIQQGNLFHKSPPFPLQTQIASRGYINFLNQRCYSKNLYPYVNFLSNLW